MVLAALFCLFLIDEDPTNLHPAFVYSPSEVTSYIAKGKELADKKKRFNDTFMSVSRKPKGVRGEGGTSHESEVACLGLDGAGFKMNSYSAAAEYETMESPLTDPDKGLYLRSLDFFCWLVSAPKVATTAFENSRFASPGDVKVRKFILTDDKGRIYTASTVDKAFSQSGTVTFSGVSTVPTVTTATGVSSTSASVIGTGGSAYGYGSTVSSATVVQQTLVPWSQDHPYFAANYLVSFPLFGADGKPLIGPDVKKLQLHIITESGERVVDYDLGMKRKL